MGWLPSMSKLPCAAGRRAPRGRCMTLSREGAGWQARRARRYDAGEPMPKVLTSEQVKAYERDGCLSPVRLITAERAAHYRAKFEALEARLPATEMKKMKTKSHLLCPWVLEIAEDPHILDVFEDLIGPNIRCWSMAWRVKKADGETFAGWHQDSSYGAALPVVLGALALSDCGVKQGCLRGVPGSHKWGILKHEESDDPQSILARGQYITDHFDAST